MTRDRRLGRGLAALLGESLDDQAEFGNRDGQGRPAGPRLHDPSRSDSHEATDSDESDDPSAGERLLMLDVNEIDENPFQPRREFGEAEIASLAESLKEHDMLQPVLVRRAGNRWQLISGERRLRAAIAAGWSQIPASVREADDRLVAELAIVENLQRKDLNAIEKALSFQRYLREHGCTQDDLGRRLKIDRSTIANLLRLLELPEFVQDALRNGAVSAGHARALLPLGEKREQIDFCNRIRREGLSVRDTERIVSEMIRRHDHEPLSVVGGSPEKGSKPAPNRHIASLEQELRSALGTKTEIRQGTRGRGRFVIHFKNNDEFERLFDHLMGGSTTDQLDSHAG